MNAESSGGSAPPLPGQACYPPPEALRRAAPLPDASAYLNFLAHSRHEPEEFLERQARELAWSRTFENVGGAGRWFPGGTLNLCRECLDRFLPAGAAETALCGASVDGAGQDLSRAELLRRVAALAGELAALALSPGQRVLLLLPPGELLAVALLAAWRLGLCAVPCDPAMEPGRLARRIRDCACAAAVVSPDLKEMDPGLLPALRVVVRTGAQGTNTAPPPVEVAAMHPALVVADAAGRQLTLPTAGFLLQARLAYRWLLDGRGARDRHGFICPSHHVSLLAGLAGALSSGGVAALLSPPRDPEGWSLPRSMGLRVVTVRGKSLPVSAAQQAVRWAHAGPELLAVEGETLEPRTFHWLREALFNGDTHVIQVLSRPEGGGFVAGPCPGLIPVRPASVALPAPGLDLLVVDRSGQPCPVNHGGLLALRRAAPGLPLELQREKPPLVLGVRVRLDAEGCLWTMGEWSPPRGQSATSLPELEAALAAIPGVEQAAVVAFSDAEGVSRTAAFVRLSGGDQDVERVRLRLRERFGENAMPDSIQVVSRLPVSRTGKLLRSVLRRVARGEEIPLDELEAVADPETLRMLASRDPRAS